MLFVSIPAKLFSEAMLYKCASKHMLNDKWVAQN